MTQEQYEQQIDALDKVAVTILSSPEAARQFMKDAGIVLTPKQKKKRRSITKKKE